MLPLVCVVSSDPVPPVRVVSPVPLMFHYSIVTARMSLILLRIIVSFVVRTCINPVGVVTVMCLNFYCPGLWLVISTSLPI